MSIQEYSAGIGHIGIPTNNLPETKRFYQKLGFLPVYDVFNQAGNQNVSFLQQGNLMIEAYEVSSVNSSGAIDHIAVACTDVDAAYQEAVGMGLKILSNGIEQLPFWENGIGYFILEGPNGERIEYCQKY